MASPNAPTCSPAWVAPVSVSWATRPWIEIAHLLGRCYDLLGLMVRGPCRPLVSIPRFDVIGPPPDEGQLPVTPVPWIPKAEDSTVPRCALREMGTQVSRKRDMVVQEPDLPVKGAGLQPRGAKRSPAIWIRPAAARAKVRDQKPRSTASWSSRSSMSPAALAVRRDLPRFDELIAITGGIVGRIPGGTTNNIGLIGTLSGRHESRTIGRTLSLTGGALGSSDMLPHRRWWSPG
jgi:hypothetical protein